MTAPILRTEIEGLKRFATGKVRDIYDLGDALLIVATDRISAFDVVMPNGIPEKGKVLTQLSQFWFEKLGSIVPTHNLSIDLDEILVRVQKAGGKIGDELRRTLEGRSMLAIKADAFPVECVVRGYLAGSLWKEYREAGGETAIVNLHGYSLPGGLLESSKLPSPIFTPATKAETGHDENISVAQASELLGEAVVGKLERISHELYAKASEVAQASGIILADTKFEFGMHAGEITLIDEALTPDSSRFWDAKTYAPGNSQPSYDKQFVRDWLESTGWDKTPPAPELPPEVVMRTSEKYLEAYARLAKASG